MITLALVTIGLPAGFLAVRLILHAVAPHTYGPAGGYSVYTAMTAGVLYTFGFIVAATLGCTAGSIDLSEGMFRHLVITGRSRLALYLARIPAGLAIIASMVAVGFALVCIVCSFAAPSALSYDGLAVPSNLSQQGLQNWAADNADAVVCHLPFDGPVGCDYRSGVEHVVTAGPGRRPVRATESQVRRAAVAIAREDYADYSQHFRVPSDSLMIKTGLWIELEAAVGFVVGLGLGSLVGQRTVSVILMIVLDVVLTPIAIRTRIPHFIDAQRAIIGVATARLEPGQLPLAFGGGGGDFRVSEPTGTAVVVIVVWLVVWSALGAWRMMTRDA